MLELMIGCFAFYPVRISPFTNESKSDLFAFIYIYILRKFTVKAKASGDTARREANMSNVKF